VRLRLGELRANPALARRVQDQLAAARGVRQVEANPLTGSVLVLYAPHERAAVLEALTGLFPDLDAGPLAGGPAAAGAAPDGAAGPRPSPADSLALLAGELNARLGQATGGLDLKVLLPASLVALGLGRLFTEGRPIPWYNLLWYGYSSFRALNPTAGAVPHPGPGPDE